MEQSQLRVDKDFERRGEKDDTNLFTAQLLQIFDQVKSITMKTSCLVNECYTISLMKLLSMIENSSVETVRIEALAFDGRKYRGNNSWLFLLWSASSMEITEKYKNKHFLKQKMERILMIVFLFNERIDNLVIHNIIFQCSNFSCEVLTTSKCLDET